MNFVLKYFSIIFFFCVVNNLGIEAQEQPHIIVIIGDDIGWNDFGFHGSSQIPTPNIDALGYNGVFLNNFYTQPSCSPSRAAFLTGKYPIRYGFQGLPLNDGEDRPLPSDIALLPEKLKTLGYKTHMVGKWHLNYARKNNTPTRRGFDTHFGYWNGFIGYFDLNAYQSLEADWNISTTWVGFDFFDGFEPQYQYQGQYVTDIFTEKSLEVIDNHNISDPLFLYITHLAAHAGANGTELGVPNITATEEKYSYIEEPMRRRYAEIVSQLDTSVGQVVKKLKEKEMLENSIILFFSDNGAQTVGIFENYGSNYPLKGLKFTLLEGGVKGSAVLFSPYLEEKGYINNDLMHITDLHTTLLNLAGWQSQENETLDGIDQWRSISCNNLKKKSQRTEILLDVDEIDGYSGLIGYSGRYKFLNGSFSNGIYDGAYGDTGRAADTPAYDINAVLESDVNQAIQSLTNSVELTEEIIVSLREQLDISSCNGKVRTTDLPCLEECLFDLWNDPCETENIVNDTVEISDFMKEALNQYVTEIEPSRKAKIDLNANPQYCNDTWFPWLDEDGCEIKY